MIQQMLNKYETRFIKMDPNYTYDLVYFLVYNSICGYLLSDTYFKEFKLQIPHGIMKCLVRHSSVHVVL